jgi:hypothetical protein
LYASLRVGTAKVASMKRSIVPARLDDELSDVNQLAGKLSDYVYAQQHFVGHSEHELDETVWKPRDSSLGVGAKEPQRSSIY